MARYNRERDWALVDLDFAETAKRGLAMAEARGAEMLVVCLLRSPAVQARLYRVSRSTAQIRAAGERLERLGYDFLARVLIDVGPQATSDEVTKALPGQSIHQIGKALDAYPVSGGKIVWTRDSPLWGIYHEGMADVGLVRLSFEFPHVQMSPRGWNPVTGGDGFDPIPPGEYRAMLEELHGPKLGL